MSAEYLSRLFTEIPDASVWRIRRIDDPVSGQRIGPYLLFGRYPNGSDQNEWKLDEFEPAVVLDRWGTGTYSIELFSIDEKGAHSGKGRSRYFAIDEEGGFGVPDPPLARKPNPLRPDPSQQRPEIRGEVPANNQTTIPIVDVVTQSTAPAPRPQAATTTTPTTPPPMVHGELMAAIQLMNFVNAQVDQRTTRIMAMERQAHEAELARQREFYVAMIDLRRPQQAPALGPAEIAEIVRQVVREELDDDDDAQNQTALVNGQPASGVPTGDGAIIAKSFENMLSSVLPLIQSAFKNGSNPAGARAPASGGD